MLVIFRVHWLCLRTVLAVKMSTTVASFFPTTYCSHHCKTLECLTLGYSSLSLLLSWIVTIRLPLVSQKKEASLKHTFPNWWNRQSGDQAMAAFAGCFILPPRLWLFDLPLWYVSQQVWRLSSKNRLHVLLFLTHVLFTITHLQSR